MTEKTIPTKEQVLTTASRKILFECLVKGLNIKQAAKEANLSYRYARKWVAESNINALVLRETAAKTEDLREEAIQSLLKIVRNENTKPTVLIRAIDTLGKMNGWHSNTLTLETGRRQHELDEARRQAARELALLRYKSLPPGDVTISDVKPVTSEDNETPDTIDGNADKKSPTSPEYKADKMD